MYQFVIGRRHDGDWKRLKPPNVGGKYGQINVIDAGSAGTVWLGGNRAAGIEAGQAWHRWSPVATRPRSGRHLRSHQRIRGRDRHDHLEAGDHEVQREHLAGRAVVEERLS
jgi:hypothetical protein